MGIAVLGCLLTSYRPALMHMVLAHLLEGKKDS